MNWNVVISQVRFFLVILFFIKWHVSAFRLVANILFMLFLLLFQKLACTQKISRKKNESFFFFLSRYAEFGYSVAE